MPIQPAASLKCPHCGVVVHRPRDAWKFTALDPDGEDILVESFDCLACTKPVIAILKGSAQFQAAGRGGLVLAVSDETERWVVYPRSYSRPLPPEVPTTLAGDYQEAAAVLQISPKASAALGRRCLQNTIREVAQIQRATLSDEIKELIAARSVTSSLAAQLDVVRTIGNFAAHPIKDTETGVVVEVEVGEAEWTLDVLDRLFDELIVQPLGDATRKQALNARIKAAGKQEIA